MDTLNVTAKGRVTLSRDILDHLGVEPGGTIELDKLQNGGVALRAARTGKIEDFIGILAGKTTKTATIEEINEAAADGWAGLVDS